MAAPIQSPAKSEVRSVIWFLNGKGERPAEIHKQIIAVYGNVTNRQNVTKWCSEFFEGRTDVYDDKGAVGYLSSLTTFFRKLKEKFPQIDAWR